MTYTEGDTIIYFSTAYGACEKTIQYICETTPATSERIDITFPLADKDLNHLFRSTVQRLRQGGKKAKIAMFDTVVTFPGVRLPWEDLTQTCRELNIMSLIDGAHGIGHVDLTNLTNVDPDFFTSNCYK